MDNKTYAIVILAAGSSARLGRPKQIVEWNDSTLLNHTIAQALPTKRTDVYLALSPTQVNVHSSLEHKVEVIEIVNHEEGMGSTISKCLSSMNLKNYEGVILSVCDQPYISLDIFNSLIQEYESSDCSIVVSKYSTAFGPPSLFSKKHYASLLRLEGDVGAKKMVEDQKVDVSMIDFLKGDIDIDTIEDYEALIQKRK